MLPWTLQAQEFVAPGAKAVTGSAGQGAASDDDWQPTLWRGLGFHFSDVLHAHEVRTACCLRISAGGKKISAR